MRRKIIDNINFSNFGAIKLGIASAEIIRGWSYGEVKKAETINYRTFKPERDGLFCEKIFGPIRDWECNCGKYKWIKHKGVICDRCGVEVTESKVRRDRMAHIDLAEPVAHVWYLRKSPSRIGVLLNMKLGDIEKIVYFSRHVVSDPGNTNLKYKQLLSEEEYQEAREKYGSSFEAGIGGIAIKNLLSEVDLVVLSEEVREQVKNTKSDTTRTRLVKQLRVVDAFAKSGNNPENMVMDVVPVIPPDLRPLVPLEGGRFASSDLNDLYRRIINRNNRLKHIMSLRAPEVMIYNEKRLLQEAVDALFENGSRNRIVVGSGNRPLKSLSDTLKGKQGRFRQNLLGKRVDYSGRSVIVVGPSLKLHQCGLPKKMALELFKPFIIRELIEQNIASSLKTAKKMLDKTIPEVWDILEKVSKHHPVLLNRAPTLHRLGIQAFEPVLVEGKAIQLHPLTCAAFNADFDGDQMAVHLPLSMEAQLEAKMLMLATNNILSPSSGKPIAVPSQDMVLGCYYMTKPKVGCKGEGMVFSSTDELEVAFNLAKVDLHAAIKIRWHGKMIDTTVGRVLFNTNIPQELAFINHVITKKSIAKLIENSYKEFGKDKTVELLDSLKSMGYHYSTLAGVSISLADMLIPGDKNKIINNAKAEVKSIMDQAQMGVITESERYNKVIDIWTHVTDEIADEMFASLKVKDESEYKEGESKFNSIYIMADSGARGSKQQIRQLAGMRGLMAKPQKKLSGGVGEIIESPITANFREGLTVLEYFISTHGGRKGLADTALKTADAGYLTRRLVDISHDMVITIEDCGTVNGIKIGALQEGDDVIETLEERVVGRVSLDNVVGLIEAENGEFKEELIVVEDEVITEENAAKLMKAGIEKIRLRSILTCEAANGLCQKCYGIAMPTGKMAEVGDAVGIIAAQSIGEPGTQLTLRTFHIGGTASRVVLDSSIIAKNDGTLQYHNIRTLKNEKGELIVVSRSGEVSIKGKGKKAAKEIYFIPYGAKLFLEDNTNVTEKDSIAEWDPYSMPVVAEVAGKIKWKEIVEGKTMQQEKNRITGMVETVILEHRGSERLNPQLIIEDKKGENTNYPLPVDSYIVVSDKANITPGTVIAKIPQEVSKTKDITGGLPRIAELFEARKPKNICIVSEIDGVVSLEITDKSFMKVVVKSDNGVARDYIIPQGKHLVVYEGDRVRAGDALTDGAVNPHDILKVKGDKAVQEYLLNEIQEVYRLQGVIINDKHIEVIVRQMLASYRIDQPGDSEFLVGEMINRFKFYKVNEELISKGLEPAVASPLLLGITKASLNSDSFISAASFQETTKVLTDASANGLEDPLVGLKENVIIGHLIPAGTGFRKAE
ncbi:MAG: DNA-directed RNA polymerase subunit beta' [bacterium]|nr:DNA-directed RNA polymerase subunit beta' [bacterium]